LARVEHRTPRRSETVAAVSSAAQLEDTMKRSFRHWSCSLAVATALAVSPAFAADKKVERLWKAKCSSCHGMDGKGQTDKGKQMKVADYSTAEWQKSRTDEQLKKAILEGLKTEKNGAKQEMDGFKADLTPEQIDQLIAFTRGLGPAK
jgi:mono/diheme cytochrome c family protein